MSREGLIHKVRMEKLFRGIYLGRRSTEKEDPGSGSKKDAGWSKDDQNVTPHPVTQAWTQDLGGMRRAPVEPAPDLPSSSSRQDDDLFHKTPSKDSYTTGIIPQ